jgi:hypothetical protein
VIELLAVAGALRSPWVKIARAPRVLEVDSQGIRIRALPEQAFLLLVIAGDDLIVRAFRGRTDGVGRHEASLAFLGTERGGAGEGLRIGLVLEGRGGRVVVPPISLP